jgi:FKBP-type peptidyl-prolyl cis-trans isomerase SlyD
MTVPMVKIQPNAFVSLDYTLRDEDGALLDSSVETGEAVEADDDDPPHPIDYVHGYGMLVPGLEAALVGLETGDEREIVVPAEEGYGEHDEDLVLEVEKSEFPDPSKVEAGDEFLAETPDGDEMPMRVVEVKDDSVIVDANHPLAGVTLHYKVKVLVVRTATEEEIENAARELAEAEEHEHGPNCDHDHDDHGHDEPANPAGGLVQLGKKRAVN